ncbi:Trans-aconitate 2-methyltransferase [Clavibacter michiganensis]|uniref:Trans-aconitate 2-methyltransferase n=1 Tax=Clavibacter michiganensis TaxID=28447 RepID=A0A251Y9G5_9MICO|nr:class I SAM-dependent methyltransferase [Clavibacter michiganensis]OUE20719.1 Trans-aconitate 2-methyltransferase [Clavibacter michiganensis]
MTIDNVHFNEGYLVPSTYDDMLPPHYYAGREDIELVTDWLEARYGNRRIPRALDIGCGNGRVTEVFASRIDTLYGSDKSEGMIGAFASRFPDAQAIVCDTERLPAAFRDRGEAPFDLITTFWSLSYPILECFEELDADGVHVVSDEQEGLARARVFLDGIISMLAEDGVLLGQFFDADTQEQRLVTELWETIHPFPGTGRRYTWEILTEHLLAAERAGVGRFTTTRLPGAIVIESLGKARQWFAVGHLNSYDPLISASTTTERIDSFLSQFVRPDGSVLLPSGMHMFTFEKTDPSRALPARLQ